MWRSNISICVVFNFSFFQVKVSFLFCCVSNSSLLPSWRNWIKSSGFGEVRISVPKKGLKSTFLSHFTLSKLYFDNRIQGESFFRVVFLSINKVKNWKKKKDWKVPFHFTSAKRVSRNSNFFPNKTKLFQFSISLNVNKCTILNLFWSKFVFKIEKKRKIRNILLMENVVNEIEFTFSGL